MEKLNINQWAEEDRPREKMASLGTEALSSAELLAILIGSGSKKESAVDLMKRILADCNNNLNTLGKMSINDLCQYNGIGEAKAISILAACELGKRRQAESPEERPVGIIIEPALPSHQKSSHLTWRHHRNSRRHPHHHEGGRPRQHHHPCCLPQPSLRQPLPQQGRRSTNKKYQ